VDVHALALSASGTSFPGGEGPALRVLFDRFSRFAFTSVWDLSTSAVRPPPLPRDRVRRMKEALKAGGVKEFERERDSFYEAIWRDSAVDVATHAETLVDALRDLIERFAGDVAVQIREALRRAAVHDALSHRTADRSELDALIARVDGYRPYFRAEEFDGLLREPFLEWCRKPSMEDIPTRVREWVASIEPHLVPLEAASEQQDLPVAPAQGPRASTNGSSARTRVLKGLAECIQASCRKALVRYGAEADLEAEFSVCLKVSRAFGAWSARVSSTVLVGASRETLASEFARQTAYVYVVRLLLVRICEDKGLFRRKLSDGGLVNWQEQIEHYLDYARGRSYEYLTRMAYECAQNVYGHFYGASELFDWYQMDEKVLLRGLVVLNCFDLARIDTDIIGTVYGRYLAEARHEQGRFYTPRPLVVEMLDMAGWKGSAMVNRRIGDMACGSGSFLVEACRRLLDAFRGPDGRIPLASLDTALREVQRSIFGIDLNPFACYLAETNLLIQVLDLVRDAKEHGVTLWVDRFQIYCTDALIAPETADVLLDREHAAAERAKARFGDFEDGFDFLVGNPPYVRADEDAPRWQEYRRRIEAQPWFTTRHQKWDLYVPFVEQYLRLLADRPDARACLVTIESIASTDYAGLLREKLAREATLHDVLFLERLRLFEDAPWQDNVVFAFSRGAPPADHVVRRRSCRGRGADRALAPEALDAPVQVAAGPDRLLDKRDEVVLDLWDAAPLGELFYVTKGMALHSNARLVKNGIPVVVRVPAGYEPSCFLEDLVEDLGTDGKRVRHKPFTRDKLIAADRDGVHARPTVTPEQVERGGIGRVDWIEYGEHTRCPAFVDRPEDPVLFDRPKVVFGTFAGVAVDEARDGDGLIVSHSLTLAIRWDRLDEASYKPVRKERDSLCELGRWDRDRAARISEWYVCALALSEPLQRWISARTPSMKGHVYPEVVRAIPVKLLSPEAQVPFIALARERHALWAELAALEAEGYCTGSRIGVPVRRLAEKFRRVRPDVEHLTLFQAAARGLFGVAEPFLTRDLSRARADGDAVRVGREVAVAVGAGVADREGVARVLARLVAALPGTVAGMQDADPLPGDEAGLLALGAFLDSEEAAVRARKDRIGAIGAEIDRLAWDLYRPRAGSTAAPPTAPARGIREGPLL